MKRLLRLIALVGILGALAVAAQIPVGNVRLVGCVKNQSGAAISGADVTISAAGRMVVRSKTNRSGIFTFAGVAGEYDVAVTAWGFNKAQRNGTVFAVGEPTIFTLLVSRSDSGYPEPAPIPIEPQAVVETGRIESTSDVPVVQKSSVAEVANSSPWEYGGLFQGGVGLEQRTNFTFFLLGGHLGKVLTPQLGSGLLRGNFEYAVEVFPVWQSYTPKFQRLDCPYGATTASQCYGPVTTGGTYRGVSITPIMLRWNFTHGSRFMPWAQAAGGLVYTTRKYPAVGDLNPTDPTQTGPAADTSVWNFTPQGGVGAHYFVRPRRSVDFSVNGVHISSASLGDKNPGVNVSLQMSVGYTWWK